MGTSRQVSSSLHGAILVVAMCAVAFLRLPWPLGLLLPLLVYFAVVLSIRPLRRTIPPLTVGQLGGMPLAVAIGLSLVTTFILIVYQFAVRPPASHLSETIPRTVFGNILVAWIGFGVINATLEEVAYRGILFGAAAEAWNVSIALAITTVLFAIGHLGGYPPGMKGVLLAGFCGFALGYLRLWTGGLGLPILCHICADATVFVILNGLLVPGWRG
jgi:membrane protease YdiL (CAAX protease family)